jgi:hypothetical protein
MNSLSWLIYAAGVVDRLGLVLFLAALSAGIFALMSLAYGISEDEASAIKAGQKSLATCLFAAWILALLPSRATVLTIAASELGGRAATSEAGRELLSELKDTVLTQLRKARGDK